MSDRSAPRSEFVLSAADRRFLEQFSDSVRGLVDRFEAEPVTVWQVVDALFRDHSSYGGGQLLPLADRPGRMCTMGVWLRLSAGLFDIRSVGASDARVIDGRLLLLALARVERELDALLRRSGVRRRIERDLRTPLHEVMLPWALPARAVEFLEFASLSAPGLSVQSLRFSPDGLLLATASADGTARLWDVVTGDPRGEPLTGHTGFVTSCDVSPDGRLVATAGADGTARLWDVATGALRGEPLTGHTDWIGWCGFSPDGRVLATTSRDHTVRMWDVATGAPRGEPLTGHTYWIQWCGFSPDGRLLATGSEDGTARLWDVATGAPRGEPLRGHAAHSRQIWWCAFSPDGRLLATAGEDKTVRLWDVVTGDPRGEPLTGHTDKVLSCDFSPDGRLLATASADTTARLWDVATGSPRGEPLTGGHPGWLSSCEFSPDGRLLATVGHGSLRLWDVAAVAARGGLVGWPEPVVGRCGFSPDGRVLATAGGDGTVRLWEAVDASVMLPSVIPDAVEGEDLLDLSADVDALANVIVAASTTPPLSIGLFGDWGAGKSFLIEQVQRRVRLYAQRARRATAAPHCAHVRNVEFNAWHYADANLWASLVSRVLDELARPEPETAMSERAAQSQLARLEEELAARSSLRDRLERARAHTDRVDALKRLLRWTWGLSAGPEGTQALSEVRRNAGTVRGWLRLLLPTGRARVVVLGLALAIGVVVGSLLDVAGVDRVARVAAGVLASVSAFATWVGVGAARVSALFDRAGDGTAVADIRGANLEAELEAARAHESQLRDELADLASGRRLARFAAERGASQDYRAQLGLVSRIHDDFVRMSEILAAQRARASKLEANDAAQSSAPLPARRGLFERLVPRLHFPVRRAFADDEHIGADLPRIDRIVLYIDDLDRCPPSRVVEVLEAVHLILALPLFVVVVAVDPRWLLQSLRLHYSKLLGADLGELHGPSPDESVRGDGTAEWWHGGARARADAVWESTPLHYLEKIIQIPFTLRPMGRKGVESLVTRLLPAVNDEVPPEPGERTDDILDGAPTAVTQTPARSDAEPNQRRQERPRLPPSPRPSAPALSPRTLSLTRDELDFAVTVGCILRTPRSVKKFTNLYRLVRARLDDESGELDVFLDAGGDDIAEYQAVLVLLAVIIAFPDEAPTFLLGIGDLDHAAEPDQRPWRGYLEEMLRRTDGRWPELVSFLADATAKAAAGHKATREPFRRWALEISRYSFATGQEVFSNYRAGRTLAPSVSPQSPDRAD